MSVGRWVVITWNSFRSTKEHIHTMSKLVGKAGETTKLSVQRARKDVEDVTKKYVKSVDEACKSKEKEILGNSYSRFPPVSYEDGLIENFRARWARLAQVTYGVARHMNLRPGV